MSAYTQEQIDALKEIGSEWQKNEMHRIYFNDLDVWYGLDCSYYNSGNICGATLDGEKISNTSARKIQGRLSGKLFFDLADNKFHGKGIEQNDFNVIVAAIKAKMNEAITPVAEVAL